MKRICKLFPLSLLALTATPASVGCSPTTNTVINLNTSTSKNVDENKMRCTITYVGKNCTKDGIAIIARTSDQSPVANFSKLKRVEHNQLANATLKNSSGFEITMPSETYQYISSPDCIKVDEKGGECLFENMAINEKGVGLSCTLTCFTNDDAQKADKFVSNGFGEEMMNQVIASQASSAREAMVVAAKIIKDKGSNDANIIMATDQNETWLMEIYTGHQFCAVKLPDDKVCVAGNEFILDTLDELGINATNKDERCILSSGLLQTAVDGGFDKYDDSGTKDLYHLHLFNTYAAKPQDSCHMRTWRGYGLFDPAGDVAKAYDTNTKYVPFFTPRDSKLQERKDITVYDVMDVYRDEYDELIGKEGFEKFTKLKEEGNLRCIATETARTVHIITSDPNKPQELACNCLYCPSAANYAPYVLLNNGIESFDGEYGYEPQKYQYDDYSASLIFRKLNALAWPEREKYGYPIQTFLASNEKIYVTQMQQVIDDACKLSSMSDTKNIITNFNKHLRDVNIETVKYLTEDLIWHDMQQSHEKVKNPFEPLVDTQQILSNLGWTDFDLSDSQITFKNGNNTGKIVFPEGYAGETGKLYINDDEYDVNVRVNGNKVYVTCDTLLGAVYDMSDIVKININDYLDKKTNNLAWIIPLAICLPVAIAAGILIPILIRKKKTKKPLIVSW